MEFIDVTSALNLGAPRFASTNAEIVRPASWLRENLHSPAHLMIAQFPEYGENHEIELEDVLDGEPFGCTGAV